MSISSIQILEERSLKIIKPIFVKYLEVIKIHKAFKRYQSRILFIQRSFRQVFITLEAKVEILENYWDKTLFKIQAIASGKNDKVVS